MARNRRSGRWPVPLHPQPKLTPETAFGADPDLYDLWRPKGRPVLRLVVDVPPVPKGRARSVVLSRSVIAAGPVPVKSFTRTIHYTPKRTRQFEDDVRKAVWFQWRDRNVLKGPCVLLVTFWTRQVKGIQDNVYDIEDPDLDNYVKAWNDAMRGILYEDDCLIVESHERKLTGKPHIEFEIRSMT